MKPNDYEEYKENRRTLWALQRQQESLNDKPERFELNGEFRFA